MTAPRTVLVTGAAGFIGYHVAARLLDAGDRVVGVDCLTDYYDVGLKRARLARLAARPGFTHAPLDIVDVDALLALFAEHRPTHVVHLAAQAGVRHSLENPGAYTRANVTGFLSVLEACRAHPPAHLVHASTSSVYGANTAMPFQESRGADHPLTLYAATKKANEGMAHAYAHLFGLPCTGLRFFTVYGPWGRPDMALFLFTRAILEGEPIRVFNHGRMRRDFTYVDDIVEGIVRLLPRPPAPDPDWRGDGPSPATSGVAPWRILNIGNGRPESLLRYIEVLERALGRPAQREMLPMQPGDVPATWADTSALASITGHVPRTSIETGVTRFAEWYMERYAGAAPAGGRA